MGYLHLIEQVLLVTGRREKPIRMDVLIDGDHFAAIAPRIDCTSIQLDERTDGRQQLMMPGLFNAHHHSHDRLDKGRFSGLPLELWMSLYNPPIHNRQWTARDVYLRTMLNGIEMLRAGITTVVDDIHFGGLPQTEVAEAAFQAYTDLGIRADVSIAWSDLPFYSAVPHLATHLTADLKAKVHTGSVANTLALWREFARNWNGRVRFVFSPSAPQRCTIPFLQETWSLAREYDRPVLVHVLETRIQWLVAQQMYDGSMVNAMHRAGLLDEHSVLAHGVWLTEQDMDLIAKSGASVIHNPACNLKLCSGIAPVAEMRARGITVGLGTDNNNGNDLNSMFDAMRLSALVSGVGRKDERAPVDAADAIEMATVGGASALGRQAMTGSIEVGKLADFILLDLDRPAFMPINDVQAQLVFSEQGQSIDRVYVAGQMVVDKGRITRVDERRIVSELRDRLPAVDAALRVAERAAEELRPALLAAYRGCIGERSLMRFLERPNAIGA